MTDLDPVLDALGLPYSTLIRPSHRPVTLPADEVHQRLLMRLQHDGVVSSWKPSKRSSVLTVNLKRS